MRSLKKITLLTILSLFLFASCKKEGTANLELRLNNLPYIGSAHFEGWLIVDNTPVSIGQFTTSNVNEDPGGDLLSFDVDKKTLKEATSFMVTIEKADNLTVGPSQFKFLAGDFKDNAVELTTNHPNGVGVDLTFVKGAFWIGSPTDNSLETNEKSGIWFYSNIGTAFPTLDLPELDNDWTYEAYLDNGCGTSLPIGKFEKVRGADDRNTFGDHAFLPGFPGEDFIRTSDEILGTHYNFPVDVSNSHVIISIAPKFGDAMAKTISILSIKLPENAQANEMIYLESKPADKFQYGTVVRN
ncbi:MAG: hypothetical protein GQ574_05085 [Crocinitomix sp.]|nr:hypothetical protein [Crocinitomix sp.]